MIGKRKLIVSRVSATSHLPAPTTRTHAAVTRQRCYSTDRSKTSRRSQLHREPRRHRPCPLRSQGARQRYKAALPFYRQVGGVQGEANCIYGLGDIALARRDHEDAGQRFEAALPLYQRVGGVQGEANASMASAISRSPARIRGRVPVLRGSPAALPRVGESIGEANCIKGFGNIALERSDRDEARQRYKAAMPLYQQAGDLQRRRPIAFGRSAISKRGKSASQRRASVGVRR